MKTRNNTVARIAAMLIVCSLLLSLAACGPAPAQTSAQTAAETAADPTQAPSQSESEPSAAPTKAPSPGVAKAGNLIEGIDPEPVEGKASDKAFTSSQYAFAARLLADSYRADGGNCLVSPLSVVLALAMTANGAASETLQQMLDVIGGGLTMEDLNAYLYQYVKNLPSGVKTRLAIANSIWLNDRSDFSVREDFLRRNVSWYNAAVYRVPFNDQTVKEINGWVAKNTDGMIDKIIDRLDDSARMILINAICFDAKWQNPYGDYSVHDAEFTRANGSTETVSMMYSSEHEYYKGEGYTGFAKYYEDGYKFVGILPNENIGLDRFIENLDGEKLDEILNSVTHTRVTGGLPKFSYDYEARLKGRLRAMGMVNAFNDDFTSPDAADFSAMSDDTKLWIDEVIHKTFIEVTQAGTRAAAVTAVIMFGTTAVQEPPKVVTLDRPFLYMIVDTATNLPIFIGTVNSVN